MILVKEHSRSAYVQTNNTSQKRKCKSGSKFLFNISTRTHEKARARAHHIECQFYLRGELRPPLQLTPSLTPTRTHEK